MEKLANVAFVLQCDGIEDRIKIAAIDSYVTSVDSLDSGEEKNASMEELDSLLKESAWWSTMLSKIAPSISRWGGQLASKGGKLSGLGKFVQGRGYAGIQKALAAHKPGTQAWWAVRNQMMGGAGKAAAGAAGKAATGAAGKSGLLNWMAAHPTSAKLGLGGAVAGSSLLGGSIYGGMKANDAYKRGYGTATSQLSPMVSALYAPQGAMSLPPSRAYRA